MNYNYYNLILQRYDVNSRCKFINNSIKVAYRCMTPQQMIIETCKDEIIRQLLFRKI